MFHSVKGARLDNCKIQLSRRGRDLKQVSGSLRGSLGGGREVPGAFPEMGTLYSMTVAVVPWPCAVVIKLTELYT